MGGGYGATGSLRNSRMSRTSDTFASCRAKARSGKEPAPPVDGGRKSPCLPQTSPRGIWINRVNVWDGLGRGDTRCVATADNETGGRMAIARLAALVEAGWERFSPRPGRAGPRRRRRS